MKFLLTIGFLLITVFSFSQTDIERALNSAEQELNRLQNLETEMVRSLYAEGKIAAQDPVYLRLKEQVKSQDEKTKALRKQFKKEKKAQKKAKKVANQNQVGVATPSQPIGNTTKPSAPVNVNLDAAKARKEEIKFLKKEIKLLKKEQKVLMKQVEASGQFPASSPAVQDFDRKILAAQEELFNLESAALPVTTASQPNLPDNINQAPVQAPVTTSPDPVATSPQPEVPVQAEVPPVLELPAIGLSTILFEKFSTEIKDDYSLYLNHVAKQMQENSLLNLEIASYTDNSEKNRVSMQITAGMANAVAQEMVNRGISPERLKVKANGSKKAVADNNNFFGQARNRRVELSFF